MKPTISVITLTHNKLPVTRKCLTSLLAGTGASWELIVVDNGSTDGTREWLGEFASTAALAGVSVTVIANQENVGCSTARNQGGARASGGRLLFMDNDVALRSGDWLVALDTACRKLPQAAVVGPKLVYPFAPHDIQCAGVGVSANGRILFRGRGHGRTEPDFNVQREVQCLISACFMVDRTAFEAVGGFDDAYNPVEFEDFDLCYKIKAAGGRCYYVPEVEMYHFESVTTQGTAALPNTYLIIRNGLLFKTRWKHLFQDENGPADAACKWRQVPIRPFAELGELPLVTRSGPKAAGSS